MKKNIRYKKDVKNRTGLMLFLLFTCFTLCLSVGYAALNSDLNISGEASFRVESDIRITDVSLYETTNLAVENYTSKYSKDTVTIGTKLTQVNSTISYKVKVQNSGTVAMWIDSIEEEAKNNSNTEYVLEGIGLKELINPGEEKEFIVKIKYKNNITTLPDNTNLDTILKFNFIKPESILTTEVYTASSDTLFFNGPLKKEKIESIEFRPTLDVIEDAIGSWDASYDKNGTVIASYKDSDGNGLYELYIGGIGKVNAPSDSSFLFRNFYNLTDISFDKYFDTSNITNMYLMFSNLKHLKFLDLSSFNTSNVTNMSSVFYNSESLINLNIDYFNTSRVTNMYQMFNGCSSLNELNVSSFDTSKVTNMKYMFAGCSGLTNLDLTNFNTKKVKDMSVMFFYCKSLATLDLSSFDTSNVTDMSYMFQYDVSLTSLNIFSFNTSNVKNMSKMFYECFLLENLDLTNFDTSNVTDMSYMFLSCKKLSALNLSSFNTEKVTTMKGMFWNCQKLTNLNISSFDTSKVTDMSNMFQGCLSIREFDLTSFDTSNVTNMGAMFYECISLKKLDLSSFIFKDDVSTSNMFVKVPISTLIYVKDDFSKEFILSVRSDLTNIQVKNA